MIQQILNVVPHGLIESGQLKLNCDEVSGLVDATDSVVVGWGWLSKTLANAQEFKIDPALLKSSAVKPGLKLTFGNMTLEVNQDSSISLVYSDGGNVLQGPVVMGLGGDYWKILSADLKGLVEGYSVELSLVSAS